jgi:hypothetical protein
MELCGLQHGDGAEHVDLSIKAWFINAHSNVCLRRKVIPAIHVAQRSRKLQKLVAVSNIEFMQLGFMGNILSFAGREIIDDMYLVAARDERIDNMGSDETGTTGDHHSISHEIPLTFPATTPITHVL